MTSTRKNRASKDVKRVVYCFWTGTNKMSSQRKSCLTNMIKTLGVEVILVTPYNINDYILPSEPLHPAYEYLSQTHKSDYLRTYFMHFYGGGYSDIKRYHDSWVPAFDDMNKRRDAVLNGYHETSSDGVAGTDEIEKYWKELPGNGAYIVRPRTSFTRTWYARMLKLLDSKLELLKKYPSKHPQAGYDPTSSPGYPIEWNEMLGRIFHRLCVNYRSKFLFTVPMPDFTKYR